MTDRSGVIAGLRAPLGRLADPLPIARVGGAFDVTVLPPGSKSLTNRAMLLAALASGESMLRGALTDADDGRVMLGALRALGAEITVHAGEFRVKGVGGRLRAPNDGSVLALENAGTAMRFLTGAGGLADAPIVLDGDPRMRERPIGELAEALGALGVRVEWLGRSGFPPLRVIPPTSGWGGGEVTFGKTRSGQFISSLLLAGPWSAQGVRVRCPGGVTSAPYVEMTLRLLQGVGVRGVEWASDLSDMYVPGGGLEGFEIDIEPDASGAGYFWSAAAMVGGARALIPGFTHGSMQGDTRVVDVLARMGAAVQESEQGIAVIGPRGGLRGVDAELSGMPDSAMALAAVACVAQGTTRLRGLRTLRDKETDRLEALRTELTKIGASVRIERAGDDESLVIDPEGVSVGGGGAPVEFKTYRDHRMAMSLALLGLVREGVRVRDPACVAKTYPGFWSDLAALYDRPQG